MSGHKSERIKLNVYRPIRFQKSSIRNTLALYNSLQSDWLTRAVRNEVRSKIFKMNFSISPSQLCSHTPSALNAGAKRSDVPYGHASMLLLGEAIEPYNKYEAFFGLVQPKFIFGLVQPKFIFGLVRPKFIFGLVNSRQIDYCSKASSYVTQKQKLDQLITLSPHKTFT